jgi:hypothetical protein
MSTHTLPTLPSTCGHRRRNLDGLYSRLSAAEFSLWKAILLFLFIVVVRAFAAASSLFYG